MLCEQCKSREATFHRVVVVDGKRGETHLCAECLQQSQQTNMPEIMASFFTPAARGGYTCENCGASLSSFQQTGRLGCANCYGAFSDAMEGILKRIHGAAQHVGRTPYGAACAKTAATATAEAKTAGAPAQKSKADLLREEIRRAVAGENYERAAKLRDEIRMLEAKGDVANEQK